MQTAKVPRAVVQRIKVSAMPNFQMVFNESIYIADEICCVD